MTAVPRVRGNLLPRHTAGSEVAMIFLTKLDGKVFMLNEELIETVSQTPDTVIVLENGHSYIVRESMEELQYKIYENTRLQRRARLRAYRKNEPLT